MTKVILSPKQQKYVKYLAVSVLEKTEEQTHDITLSKDIITCMNIENAALDFNKTLFKYKDNTPVWNLEDIQNKLNKLIYSVPRAYRDHIPYQKLQKYLRMIYWSEFKSRFVYKIKQIFDVREKIKGVVI